MYKQPIDHRLYNDDDDSDDSDDDPLINDIVPSV